MRNPLETVVWGSIGCGDVMEVKSGPALQGAPGFRLAAVMARHISHAEDFARRHHVPRWYDGAEDLVSDPEVNAIYIATPPDSHLYYTKMAAAAGKPVYVEKPMANSFMECEAMIRACRDADVPLFVAYYRRELPAYLKVKEILASQVLGEIRQVDMQLIHRSKPEDRRGDYNWRVVPEIAGCGYFCDLASHMLDLIQFLLGDIIQAEGRSANTGHFYQAEDQVKADFQFDNGIQGKGTWDFNAQEQVDRTRITGSQGSVSYSHFINAPVTLETAAGTSEYQLPHPKHIQLGLITKIVAELRGQGHSPSTGETAAKTNWTMDKILGRI